MPSINTTLIWCQVCKAFLGADARRKSSGNRQELNKCMWPVIRGLLVRFPEHSTWVAHLFYIYLYQQDYSRKQHFFVVKPSIRLSEPNLVESGSAKKV